jgi:hypothetical protein
MFIVQALEAAQLVLERHVNEIKQTLAIEMEVR